MLGQVWRNGVKYLNRKGVGLGFFKTFMLILDVRVLLLVADFTLPCESIVKATSPQGTLLGCDI